MIQHGPQKTGVLLFTVALKYLVAKQLCRDDMYTAMIWGVLEFLLWPNSIQSVPFHTGDWLQNVKFMLRNPTLLVCAVFGGASTQEPKRAFCVLSLLAGNEGVMQHLQD